MTCNFTSPAKGEILVIIDYLEIYKMFVNILIISYYQTIFNVFIYILQYTFLIEYKLNKIFNEYLQRTVEFN